MTIYLLKNGKNNQIVRACDMEDNALILKANLLKTGEYDLLNIESIEVDDETIEPLSVVRVMGSMTNNGPKVNITAYNPETAIDDTLTFRVNGPDVRFTGFVNLNANELAVRDISDLTTRVKNWVNEEYKERLENDNPV